MRNILKYFINQFSILLGKYKKVYNFLVILPLTIDSYYLFNGMLKSYVASVITDIFFFYLILSLIVIVEKYVKYIAISLLVLLHSFVFIHTTLLVASLLISRRLEYYELFLILSETTKEEIVDFFSSYWFIFIPISLFWIAYVLVELKRNKTPLHTKHLPCNLWLRYIVMLVMLMVSIINLTRNNVGFCGNFANNIRFISKLNSTNDDLVAANQIRNIKCDFISSNIIIIIGESHNKYHSELYGYEKQTNPYLSELKNITVFNNVISPNNITYSAFCYFLTSCRIDEDKEWYKYPLFPCVFKQAGYNVLFWDNQVASCSYLRNKQIDCFSCVNRTKYEFDEDLINDYKNHRSAVERDSNNLVIFHLFGQHFDYDRRFPFCRKRFEEWNYKNRSELSAVERQCVADYDNATLYNDSIVYEIFKLYENKDAIMIYFSDHGEEVFDYRLFKGRANVDPSNIQSWLHYNFDIPFIVYTTDLYKEKHPNIVRKIENAKCRPYEIDDLPFFLYELAGIDNAYQNSKRSVINDSFEIKRERFVTRIAGDSLYNYDSLCNSKEWKKGWK